MATCQARDRLFVQIAKTIYFIPNVTSCRQRAVLDIIFGSDPLNIQTMSSLVDAEEELPKSVETLAELERRHKAEIRKLEGETRALLKTAKKSNRAQIEAQIIQMQYDLKSRHNEEIDALESSGGTCVSTSV